MAVILSVPQQSYAPQVQVLSPTLNTNKTEIIVSLSRVSWPIGPCLRVSYSYPDGTLAGTVSFDGGNTLNRAGQPISSIGLRAKSSFLPQGQYSITIEVLQTITTAITISDA
mgnify:CR=1 FL=1